MSGAPNRKIHEDGGNGSGNHSHPSGPKYPLEDHGTYSGIGGNVVVSSTHDYHAPYDLGEGGSLRSPLLPNMSLRVPTPVDSHSDHVGQETRIEFRDSKDNSKDIKSGNRELKPDSRESIKFDGKDSKHEKLDKEVYIVSNSHLNWKDMKLKKYPDVPGGNADMWHTSQNSLHDLGSTGKEGLLAEKRDFAEVREAVGENKADMKMDDKFKDKDRKRKEVKHWDVGEREKERSDRRNNLLPGNSSIENKELLKEERDSERLGNEKKDPQKEKEKLVEKEKDTVKMESWNGLEKEVSHNEKELVDVHDKSNEQEKLTEEPKKKDYDNRKNADREAREKKKKRDDDVDLERPEKRSKYNEKELDEGDMHVKGGTDRDREAFNSGIQQRKRMLRPRGSPQTGSRDPRARSGANDHEGSQGKTVVYKSGECMQELIKLWKEYESSLGDKAIEGSQIGPTLEICIPAEHITATNRQVRGRQLWGTDVYTVDSDLVAVLMHTGYCRATASPAPAAIQELRATIRVLPPNDCYISTLRNNVRSRSWGAAISCSYRVERCCIVKKGGGIIDLEPCLSHSSTREPTLAPLSVERTMTTRAAASNALRQQRFMREVTVQYNHCMEPWLKYKINAVADKGLKMSLYTSARLKEGEVLYVETHSRRYELCFIGEKAIKAVTAPHVHGEETGKTPAHSSHLANGERNAVDNESNMVDIYRWSRCKRPHSETSMQTIGIPLPPEHLEVLEDNLEWEDIYWSQTGAFINGKEYHFARAHFISV